MTRILITGANGFIGSHIARACLSRGDEVHAVLRPSSSMRRLSDISDCIHAYYTDYASVEALKAVMNSAQPEVIFHSAARTRFAPEIALEDLPESVHDNLSPLINVLSAAATCDVPPGALVRLGTIAEYGENETPSAETVRECPRDTYGVSMLAGTRYLEAARPRLPFHAVTARLALTYGPGQSTSFFVPQLIDALVRKQPVEIRRPHDKRDLINVDDVVRALLMIADDPQAAGSVINVCTGVAADNAEIARLLLDITGEPEELAVLSPQTDPPVALINDPGLIKSRYDWEPEIPLREGLERTVRWARANMASEVDTQRKVSQA